jgi:hypothetical protein
MFSIDLEGSGFIKSPLQTGAIGLKLGVTFEVIPMVIVVVAAHCPADGVNVYNVVAVLFSAGDQLPAMPSSEVVGKGLIKLPVQTGATCENVGILVGTFTVIVIVAVEAHWFGPGVKVYVVVFVLSNAGDQEPVKPSRLFVGNEFRLPPAHIGATWVNVGVCGGGKPDFI